MATVVEEPGPRALDLPAVLHDLKACAGVLHDLQVNVVGVLQAVDPVAQPLGVITRIDPAFPEPCYPRGNIPFS